MNVDLLFPLQGKTIPLDHGYSLYACLSRLLGTAIHQSRDVGIFAIRGTRLDREVLAIDERSSLRLRIPDVRIKDMLPLVGKQLQIDGHNLRVGVPRVLALIPAATLAARMVEIKLSRGGDEKPSPEITSENFLAAARKKLTDSPHEDPGRSGLGLSAQIEAAIPLHTSGPRAGQPWRKVLRIKGQTHVGYSLIVSGLSADESIRLQETGIGGRRLMGCGLFLALSRGRA